MLPWVGRFESLRAVSWRLAELFDQADCERYLDGELLFWPRFFSPEHADELMHSLERSLPWRQHYVAMFGRKIAAPRLSSWHGDAHCSYRYSGQRYQPDAWTPELLQVRDALHAQLDPSLRFNCVLGNWYRSGAEHMGWHSDDEPELGNAPRIASVSFGAERRFCLRKIDRSARCELRLLHGSVLLMGPAMQTHWQHALPPDKRMQQSRLNLTFRWIAPPSS